MLPGPKACPNVRRSEILDMLFKKKSVKDKLTESDIPNSEKTVSYRRLIYESLPELWGYQAVSGFILICLSSLLFYLLDRIAETNGSAVTTANMKSLLLSWRLPLIGVTGFVLVAVFFMIEILAQIHNSYDVLNGNPAGIRREFLKVALDVRRFLNPAGIGLIVFVFLAVPLTGIGFGISLTESFYIPRFMGDYIWKNPLLAVGTVVLYAFLIFTGIRWLFVFHAVLIDRVDPAEGKKISTGIIKKHWKALFVHFLKYFLIVSLIYLGFFIVFNGLPRIWLERNGEGLPPNYPLTTEQLMDYSSLTDVEKQVFSFRMLSLLYALFNKYFEALFLMLSSAYLMLEVTREYLLYTRGVQAVCKARPRRFSYKMKAAAFVGMFLLITFASNVLGILYSYIFVRETPVQVIAHRCGGNLAAENSLEGIQKAIASGCYGSETDVQRTKDGFYIISHDDTFQRLCGDSRSSRDMTLEEIRSLTIKDRNGQAPVPTLDEMLDASRGREVLFIELKGKTADRQMVDDVVRMVREKDCVDDVALISLNYDLIDYAETTYPEFDTGILVFAGIGGIERMNCDILIMEEEMTTNGRIDSIHRAGKQAVSWTVNTKVSMERFLNSDIDGIITDEVEMAQETMEELSARSDLEVITDSFDAVLGRIYIAGFL